MRWVDKYRPDEEKDYIFNEDNKLLKILKRKDPVNLVLYGKPGTGKTTFARMYGKYHNSPYDSIDYHEITANALVGVAEVRDILVPRLNTMCLGDGMKVIHLEECDNLTPKAAVALKPLMENYPSVAFILTTNNLYTLDAAIKSRCDVIECKLSDKGIAVYVRNLLDKLDVQYNPSDVAKILQEGCGDMRAIVKALELRYA